MQAGTASPSSATAGRAGRWRRLEGDGLSRLVEEGNLLERGGCNFSHVKGRPCRRLGHRSTGPELAGAPFEALGVSLVIHPRNPYVPTVHMNVRMFAALPGPRAGGLVRRRHGPHALLRRRRTTRRISTAPAATRWRPSAPAYPRFKRWCDEYFFLKHRNEPRGIGGVFFDDFAELGFERGFA